VPAPEPRSGHVVVAVKAVGLNHAEIHFRRGVWGDVARISGIECVGVVSADPDGRFRPGQNVTALIGDMGPTFPTARSS
jgi:NADPH:quinone reductase-like Zn-dependent oxidoreductase